MHSSTGLSKEMPQKGLRALLNLAAEVTKALCSRILLQSTISRDSCSGVLLDGHYSWYKALDSQINSKLQNSPTFFFIPLLSSKRPQFTFTEQPLVAAQRHYHVPITCCGAKNWLIWIGASVTPVQRSALAALRHVLSSAATTLRLVQICQHS